MPYRVITHDGKAHIDEVMAIACLTVGLGEAPAEILRIGSNEAAEKVAGGEIPADTWVIDCGLAYDTERRLFDHHQDRDLPAAALLVFRHFFPELEGSDLASWFNLASRVDTRGARSLEDSDVVGESRDYWSFSHQLLVKAFESDPEAAAAVAAVGLGEKIRFEELKKRAAAWVAVPGRLVDVEISGFKVLEYTEQPPADIQSGLKGIDGDIIQEHEALAVYGFDKNDAGIRTLYRTDIGHDRLDFTRAEAADALFCHQGGFLMRFRPSDEDEWKRIIAASLQP